MPHKVSASLLADPSVSMHSVQEHSAASKAAASEIYSRRGYRKSTHGAKAPHHKQSDLRDAVHLAPHPKAPGGGMLSGGGAKAARAGQAPPASSLMGSLGIISSPSGGRDREMGIPGIITSTSLGPEQRQRLVAGIIESPMGGAGHAQGPVHKVMGHDATAYNEGMIHIRGSHFK